MSADPRFDELVSGYLDGALDSSEVAELDALVKSDPQYARRFVTLSRIHASLRELHGSAVAWGDSETQLPNRRRAGASAFRRAFASLAPLGLAAAALLALVVFLFPPERLIGPTVGSPGAPEALLVVGRVDPDLGQGDLAVQRRLVTLGFRVTPVKEDAVTAEFAGGRSLIIISESIRSDLIGARLAGVPVPILNCEPHLNFALGLSRRPGTPSDHFGKTHRFRVRIVSPEHPLAAGLKDLVRVYESKGTVGWGLPADSAVRIAVCDDNPDQATIFACEKQVQVRGEPLALRRVSFFLSDRTEDAVLLTADGWKLFDAAVTWLMGR